ncbi:MAG TPA: DUF4326 domain-containing protein [Myxococcota bacterium]|nr:DUF4326 domain-containing protein [Myxococcota bacterium]
MKEPRVINKRRERPAANAVYVGRPSRWGNPFVIGADGSRAEVIQKYRRWILRQPLDLSELRGRDLVCWCAPAACHADVLLELANRARRSSHGRKRRCA